MFLYHFFSLFSISHLDRRKLIQTSADKINGCVWYTFKKCLPLFPNHLALTCLSINPSRQLEIISFRFETQKKCFPRWTLCSLDLVIHHLDPHRELFFCEDTVQQTRLWVCRTISSCLPMGEYQCICSLNFNLITAFNMYILPKWNHQLLSNATILLVCFCIQLAVVAEPLE